MKYLNFSTKLSFLLFSNKYPAFPFSRNSLGPFGQLLDITNKLEKAAHKALEVFDDALPSKENRLRIIDNYKVSIPLTYNNLPFVLKGLDV